jgi:hypothetical protein
VTQSLKQAAQVLGEPLDARWQEVEEKLPPYTIVKGPDGRAQIGLWDGLVLEESHRHHSHLAGIWPFCSFDPLAPEHFETVGRSMEHWTGKGAGMWTGWGVSWAVILCSRLELPDQSLAWLKWLDHFTNVGYGTRHNADFSGVSVFNNGEFWRRESGNPENEIMQMDATMGFLIGVCEMLVQNRSDEQGRNVIHVVPGLPRRWRELEFDGIRCEGAFLVGATVQNARVQEIRVRSERGGTLRLAQPDGTVLEQPMQAGEELALAF